MFCGNWVKNWAVRAWKRNYCVVFIKMCSVIIMYSQRDESSVSQEADELNKSDQLPYKYRNIKIFCEEGI